MSENDEISSLIPYGHQQIFWPTRTILGPLCLPGPGGAHKLAGLVLGGGPLLHLLLRLVHLLQGLRVLEQQNGYGYYITLPVMHICG